jgi:hypothetical protein
MSGDYMTKLHWHNWGRRRTNATGVYYMNLCDPCAAGHTKHMPGKLTLTRIVVCRGVRIYSASRAVYYMHGRWHASEGFGQPTNPCTHP